MEVKCDRVGDGRSNFLDDVPACVSAVSDDHDLHRTADISEVEDGLGQIHFLACRDQDCGVKDFPADPVDRPVAVADFYDGAPGTVQTLFHLLTTVRTNQQRFFKATQQRKDHSKKAALSRQVNA